MHNVCSTVSNHDGLMSFSLIPIMLQLLYLMEPNHRIICFIAQIIKPDANAVILFELFKKDKAIQL